jgi:trimethyllysine dioxygenase
MFHLLSHKNGRGGESLFVDGFAAAAYLRDHAPELYACLNRQHILSHASGNTKVGELANDAIDPRGFPVMVGGMSSDHHDHHTSSQAISDGTSGSRISRKEYSRTMTPLQIRWNNDDRQAQQWPDLRSIELWYRAAREWTRILKMSEFEIKIQLRPGEPVIFDNWRYLHGRTAFSGQRRICGGYSKSLSISM